MPKRFIRYFYTAWLILALALLTTFASYAVVTRRNVPMDPLYEYVTLTDGYIVNLPCGHPDFPDWHSNEPVLPEARGIPFNYHFWNPCDGHHILRNGFLLDVGFWVFVYSGTFAVYRIYKVKVRTPRR